MTRDGYLKAGAPETDGNRSEIVRLMRDLQDITDPRDRLQRVDEIRAHLDDVVLGAVDEIRQISDTNLAMGEAAISPDEVEPWLRDAGRIVLERNNIS